MKPIQSHQQQWDTVIESRSHYFKLKVKELWEYRDLLFLLVKRDYIAFYKQTILGPVWFFLQPLLTMAMYLLVFHKLAGLGTDGVPAPLFYLIGIVAWNYFADCFTKTATVFRDNAETFGKVYFPRLILPVSIVVSSLVRFGVQLLLFILLLLFYVVTQRFTIVLGFEILLLPVFILLMALFGLGVGLITSAFTTKYRDLIFLVTFGVQLYMFATPVVYSVRQATNPFVKQVILLNPLTPIMEGLRLSFLGRGYFHWPSLLVAVVVILLLLVTGIVAFNKTERDFIDTI